MNQTDAMPMMRRLLWVSVAVLAALLLTLQAGVMAAPDVIEAMLTMAQRLLIAAPILAAVLLPSLAGACWMGRLAWMPSALWPLCVRWTLAAGLLLWLVHALAVLGLFSAWMGWTLGIAGAIALAGWLLPRSHRLHVHTSLAQSETLSLLWLVPGAVLLFTAALMAPGLLWRMEAMGYDALSYHLQLPLEWLIAGQMRGLTHNVYSFLPGLMEAGYLHVITLQGPTAAALITAQLLHGFFALLLIACLMAWLKAINLGRVAGPVAGMVLVLPWVLITASLAYNEMAMLAFAAAMGVLLTGLARAQARRQWPVCATVLGGASVLAALAVLAKPTALFMLVLPLGLLSVHALWRAGHPLLHLWRPRLGGLLAVLLVLGLLTCSPWLLRNARDAGNPLFPYATTLLGSGHWDAQQVARWHDAHHRALNLPGIATATVRQWWLNPGYGALGGWQVTDPGHDIAHFGRAYGLPLFWLLALAGLMVSLVRPAPGMRPVAVAMLFWLALQWLGWALLTHHQSRFLLPTLLPGAILVAIAFEALDRLKPPAAPRQLGLATAGVVLLVLYGATLNIFWQQTPRVTLPTPDGGVQQIDLPLAMTLTLDMGRDGHVLNASLEPGQPVYLIADNQRLAYLHAQARYASPFDAHPLADDLASSGSLENLLETWRSERVAIWLNQHEIQRLRATYGLDPRLDDALLEKLIRAADRREHVGDQGLLLRFVPAAAQ